MKKIVPIVFILLMVFCLFGCSNTKSKTKTIKIDEPAETESVEYTLYKVEFAKSINYSTNDSFMHIVDGRHASEGTVFGIVMYKIKNIGKKSIPILYSKESGRLEFTGVGRFVYGDGYTYENGFYDGRKPYAYLYNESPESASSYSIKDFLDPLTSIDSCITYFTIPEDIVKNTDEKLFYEISFPILGDEITLRYEVTDREIAD